MTSFGRAWGDHTVAQNAPRTFCLAPRTLFDPLGGVHYGPSGSGLYPTIQDSCHIGMRLSYSPGQRAPDVHLARILHIQNSSSREHYSMVRSVLVTGC